MPGVEAYFHPDLEQWKRDAADAEQAKIDKKASRKLIKEQEKLQTKIIVSTDENDETESLEMSNALTIENEEESKSTKHFNPVNRRHHLVLLPKNQQGLQKIFAAVSKGYLQGFYKFPRIDSRILKEAAKDGDIIATSACLHPDAILYTNFGPLTIRDVFEKYKNGEELLVFSYDTKTLKASFERITWAGCTRKNAKLVRLSLKDGKVLTLTPDHKVFTKSGWKEAQFLTSKDAVLAIQR